MSENDKLVLQNIVEASHLRCRMGGTFATDFYARFLSYPEIAEKFSNADILKQAQLFDQGIRHVILFYHKPKFVTTEKISALGESHSKMNIAPHLYDIFMESLLETVKEHDPDYDDNIRTAWVEVASHGLSVMISMFED